MWCCLLRDLVMSALSLTISFQRSSPKNLVLAQMLKDYAETAAGSQRTPATTLESIPTVLSYCQAPLSLLWALGPSQSCICLGREGRQEAFLQLWVGVCVWPPGLVRTTVSSVRRWQAERATQLKRVFEQGIKPAGAEAEILHSLKCLGEPEKGWGQLYLVRVSWHPVSHRSLPHRHFFPVFVSLQANVILIAITLYWLSVLVNHHPHTLPREAEISLTLQAEEMLRGKWLGQDQALHDGPLKCGPKMWSFIPNGWTNEGMSPSWALPLGCLPSFC